MKRHIPNLLTCCNLLCGCLGILHIFGSSEFSVSPFGRPELGAAFFVWTACVFDFFDGFSARALRVSSAIGKELDSLADVISFGLLPSLFLFTMIRDSISEAGSTTWLPFVALSVAVLSALRLAIFNVDETQKDSFRGLPTPANALFLTALPALHDIGLGFLLTQEALVGIAILSSLLLVAPVELFALKFKSCRWSENALRFTFLAIAGLLLITLKVSALPVIILTYLLMSLGIKAFSR